MKGTLYLIPSALGDTSPDVSVPAAVKEIINSIDHYIVEGEKSARRFLKKIGIRKDIGELDFVLLNEHSRPAEFSQLLKPLREGKNVGLLSEAGCPATADPGSEIVLMAHREGIRVVPMVGASSIILAVMASGLNGQNFSFIGYLPVERHHRIKKIREIERESGIKNQTQVFIETPYRNVKLLEDILGNCRPETVLCIACNITLPSEFIATKTIQEWKGSVPDINKKPAVFLIHS